MSEFELSTRFSLKSVVLARMSILGVLDFIILACLVPLCWIGNNFSFIQTGTYIVVPYLLTVNLSLWVTRHIHSREAIYGCMTVAVLVCGINVGFHYSFGNHIICRYAFFQPLSVWYRRISCSTTTCLSIIIIEYKRRRFCFSLAR